MTRWWGLVFLLGCSRQAEGPVREAEFGVFFGGQVQQLKEISKELDPAREQHGFRLVFRSPLAKDARVGWELSLPSDKPGPRPAQVGETWAKAGDASLDVPLAFRQSDPLGLWHCKVTFDGATVIDRDFSVVAPPPPPKMAPKPLAPRAPSGEASSNAR